MSDSLFPGLITLSDSLFIVSYEGPSFDGKIGLHDLAEEIAGFEICLNSILQAARRGKIIDINPYDFEFVVEPFQKGSFKKVIKLVPKQIEKYPATTNAALTIALIFVGIGQVIVSHGSQDVQNLTPALLQSVTDKVKLELLVDKDFLKAYAKIVDPLTQTTDAVKFTQPNNKTFGISYAEKEKFVDLTNDDLEFITEEPETLIGRVTRVDLTATKNALGIKVNDSGSTVPCSFLDSIGSGERKDLLDKWIQITGITGRVGEERKHITIYSYELAPQSEQAVLPFIEH